MSAEDRQQTLVGSPSGESVTIRTSGRMVRPLLELPAAIVDEAKFRFDDAGLHIKAVDPANVGLIKLDVPPEAFETYELEAEFGVTIGISISGLQSDLRAARMGKSTDDPVRLSLDETATRIEVRRGYDGTTLRQTEERLNIDSDTIRKEPDPPDMDLPCRVRTSPRAFAAAVEHVDRHTDHADIVNHQGTLVVAGAGEDPSASYSAAAHFEDTEVESGDGEKSKFSLDYLSEMADALVSAKTDQLTVEWGEEFPATMEFARSDSDGGTMYEGRFTVAPRITDEGDE